VDTLPVIDWFLAGACPSIQNRVRKELLQHNPSTPEMVELQSHILQDAAVEEVTRSQALDGWIGESFHGSEGMEAGIRLLCEKGVEPEQPVLRRALQALEHDSERLELGIGRVGRILDDLGFGGTQAIRAALFAQAGCEDHPIVQEQIAHSLQIFQTVNQVESIESLAQPYRGSLVFRLGVCWPSIYHLRLLAWTQTWRRKDDLNMLVESVQRLVNLSPLPNLHEVEIPAIARLFLCMISTPILPG
jgi:hypothetical protein